LPSRIASSEVGISNEIFAEHQSIVEEFASFVEADRLCHRAGAGEFSASEQTIPDGITALMLAQVWDGKAGLLYPLRANLPRLMPVRTILLSCAYASGFDALLATLQAATGTLPRDQNHRVPVEPSEAHIERRLDVAETLVTSMGPPSRGWKTPPSAAGFCFYRDIAYWSGASGPIDVNIRERPY